jgi:nucleotide-binding universal stress UspA family protein
MSAARAIAVGTLDAEGDAMTITRVLVAVDFSPASMTALDFARNCALQLGGTLSVVHVIDRAATARATGGDTAQSEAEASKALAAALADAPKAIGARIAVLRAPGAADAILDYAHLAGAELIIIGMHGNEHGPGYFMGSVAQQVVRRAECPVLTLRAGDSSAARTPQR